MKKIREGKYAISTTKYDAISKFMQLQGACRETLTADERIQFYCSKKGRLTITDPPSIGAKYRNATNLYGRVIEQDDETYVTYYTGFSKWNYYGHLVGIVISILGAILALFLEGFTTLILTFLCIVVLVADYQKTLKGKANAWLDSDILIRELEERVNAVNRWDD